MFLLEIYQVVKSRCSELFFVFLLLSLLPLYLHAADEGVDITPTQYQQPPSEAVVDVFSGGVNYHYAFTAPPIRGGKQLLLGLQYRSDQSGEDWLAPGWTLPIPTISRFNRTGIDQLYTSDTFVSSLDGELVSIDGIVYQPRYQQGTKNEYRRAGIGWEMFTSDGLRYRFGEDAASQLVSASGTKIFLWSLDEQVDTQQNTVAYEYTKGLGALYPSTISYNDASTVVSFTTSEREAAASYRTGFPVIWDRRLSSVSVSVQGELSQQYDYSYAGDNLVSVTQHSYRGGLLDRSKTDSFSYTDSEASHTWELDESWVTSDQLLSGPGTRFADVNGDTLPDMLISYRGHLSSSPHRKQVRINTGTGWGSSGGFAIPDDPNLKFWDAYNNVPGKGMLVDINADGLMDLAASEDTGSGGTGLLYFYINTGTQWERDTTWDRTFAHKYHDGIRFADVNGDGLPDYLMSFWHYSQNNHRRTVALNSGGGWRGSGGFSIPSEPDLAFWQSNFGTDYRPGEGKLTDVNADGLVDLLYFENRNPNTIKFYINTGSTWEYDEAWDRTLPDEFAPGTRFADIDGDRDTDLLWYWMDNGWSGGFQAGVMRNTGSGWASSPLSLPRDSSLALWNNNSMTPGDARITDVNADGLIDFIVITDEVEVYLNTSRPVTLLQQITHAAGGTTDYQYATPALAEADNYPRIITQVVTYVTKNNNFGLSESTLYHYRDADFWYGSSTDKRFAGFGVVEVTSALGAETTYYHQGNGDNLPMEAGDSEAKIGRPYLIETYE